MTPDTRRERAATNETAPDAPNAAAAAEPQVPTQGTTVPRHTRTVPEARHVLAEPHAVAGRLHLRLRRSLPAAAELPAPAGATQMEYPAVLVGQAEPRSGGSTRSAPKLLIRSVADVAAAVDAAPLPQWLFQRAWAQGDYGVLSADDKAGKTWAMLDAGVSVASGTPWLGQFPCPVRGRAVLFLGEGGERKMIRRLRAICTGRGLQLERLDIDLCFRTPHLSDDPQLDELRRHLRQRPALLIIIDPLYLAARGASGSDLYAMAGPLQDIQLIAQAGGSSLLIAHHWNKTGGGRGGGDVHKRSSGVGPGAWGRVLISVGVAQDVTDPSTGATRVTQTWSFRGDEIPDHTLSLQRHVRADDPNDLTSPLHYEVLPADSRQPTADSRQPDDEQRYRNAVLRILRDRPWELTKSELVKTVGGKAERVRDVIEVLAQNDKIRSQQIPRLEKRRRMSRWLYGLAQPVPDPGPCQGETT